MPDDKTDVPVEAVSVEIPAAGNDPDSRRRELKAVMATAEARGDDDIAKAAREELDELADAQRRAATARKAAADAADDPDQARKAAPVGRTATPAKATTKQADPAKVGQAGDEGKK